jgi:hypothetical protein
MALEWSKSFTTFRASFAGSLPALIMHIKKIKLSVDSEIASEVRFLGLPQFSNTPVTLYLEEATKGNKTSYEAVTPKFINVTLYRKL